MQSVDKKYFVVSKGINTEAPLVAWPEGFTVDEQNFDLLQDGSRRRRLGVSYEAGGSQEYFTASGSGTDLASGTKFYRWRNVNNDDSYNFVVAQIGGSIHVWQDPISGPLGLPTFEFDLASYKVSWTDAADPASTYTATDVQVRNQVVSFAEAEGKLVVTGPHIEPLTVSLEDNKLVGERIKFEERDLFGVEDGVSVEITPAELTDTHKYNLYSRGWTDTFIDEVKTAKGVYPAKNMISFLGLRRQTEAEFSDTDGIRVFSPQKLFGEIFQNMSAPQGHIVRDPFNRRVGFGSMDQSPVTKTVASITDLNTTTGIATVTTDDAAHGVLVGDDIELSGCKIKVQVGYIDKKLWLDGVYTVGTIVDANKFTINLSGIVNPTMRYIKTIKPGQYTVGGLISAPFEGFEPSQTRFSNVAAFAGRLFYGGCPDIRLADRVYFSKVIEDDSDFGKCLQEADPTSEFISDVLPSDGGYITIPNLGTLRSMVPYGRALLLFSSEGVWAVGPGQNGLFSAIGYSVQKLTDAGCIAPQSVIVADNTPLYWSTAGIYAIMEDSNSGYLSAQNVSQNVINSLYHSIRFEERQRAKAVYDPVRKRALFLYNSRLVAPPDGMATTVGAAEEFSTSLTPIGIIDDTHTDEVIYDHALIFDLRLGAWIKWYFGKSGIRIRDVYALPANYASDDLNGAIRFLCQEELTQKHYIGGLTSTEYTDWDTEAPAFIYTGPDSLGEPERYRYAPYVHVFMRKETSEPVVLAQSPIALSFVGPDAQIDLIVSGRTSSLFMQPRWDWSRGLDSGKITSYVQVYREVKKHPDSFGMVVTKNKVRGRGRNLFLAFKAGAKSPAWLEGWTIKYDAQMRI